MQRSCRQCSSAFEITDDDLAFYEKVSPVFAGKKELIPPPTLCPECRMQRRLAWRNDRSLYQTVSSFSGKPIISMYNPARGLIVWDQAEWWSDGWNPLAYGTTFDSNQPFFVQFAALQMTVPRFNVFNRDTENCTYVNYAPHCKNCYLTFGSWFNEDCFYGQTLTECKNSVDCLFLEKSELCYECVDCQNSYHAFFCQDCADTSDSFFCYDCRNVRNCIGCWNLRQKEYYLFNEPSTKEEYEKIVTRFPSFHELRAYVEQGMNARRTRAIHQAVRGIQNENASGDFLYNCRNVRHCFSAYRCQDIAYCARLMEMKDSLDFEGGGKGELAYEGMSNDFCYRSIAGMTCEQLTDAHYCDLCFECKDCFGCIALRHKQYCVLNTQYTKEEYEDLVPKIIEHMRKDGGGAMNRSGTPNVAEGSPATGSWGEFFPVDVSPFAYNETMAQEYFPLPKEEILRRGWRWKDQTEEMPKTGRVVPAAELPNSIDDVPDDAMQWIIECEATKRPFKIIKQELEFYRTMRLPVPHLHPDERHRRRMALRNPRKLWDRECAKCGKAIATSYAPERPEVVYCEQCYLQAVY